MTIQVLDRPDFLVVGQDVTLNVQYRPESADDTAQYYAQLDSVSYVDRELCRECSSGSLRTLRRMRSTESLQSSSSSLPLNSPTRMSSLQGGIGTFDANSNAYILPLSFSLTSIIVVS